MTDSLDNAHAQAVLSLLQANGALAGKVYDGVVPAPFPELPFVLVYTSIEWPAGDAGMGNAFDHDSVTCRATFIVHCVAANSEACRTVTMQVRESLLDVAPAVTGRSCTRLTLDDAQPAVKDETTGNVVMDAVVTYSYASVPA